MIYAALSATSGDVESVWGHQMRVKTIDSSQLEQVKADGWHTHPQAVIDELDVLAMQAENEAMKKTLDVSKYKERIAQLEAENTVLKDRLAVYESSRDTNQDGVVGYDEMTVDELKILLEQRKVSYKARDSKADLVKLAQESEV